MDSNAFVIGCFSRLIKIRADLSFLGIDWYLEKVGEKLKFFITDEKTFYNQLVTGVLDLSEYCQNLTIYRINHNN